ncbi:UNVERIFIED_CONTAM: hypothetical protein RMT77_011514 [Armadillidium vulgare]
MDHNGYDWGANGGMPMDDSDGSENHQSYCQINLSGTCTCYGQEQTNNNDYSELRKKKASKKEKSRNSDKNNGCYGDGISYHDSYGAQFDHQYPDQSQSESRGVFFTSSYENERSSSKNCLYCDGSSQSSDLGNCRQCSGHRNSTFGESFRSEASSSRQGHYNATQKIQVTAKILFGTVGAITDLKQKKASKNSK